LVVMSITSTIRPSTAVVPSGPRIVPLIVPGGWVAACGEVSSGGAARLQPAAAKTVNTPTVSQVRDTQRGQEDSCDGRARVRVRTRGCAANRGPIPWHSLCHLDRGKGGLLSRRTLGILAGMVGSALGAWCWARYRSPEQSGQRLAPARDPGTVIFDNTPTAVESDVL
jgi:hypothetical protein